jgi:hypothetical protein
VEQRRGTAPAPVALYTAQTPDERRAEEGRNIVSLFWAMLLIAAKYVARDPRAAQLGFGGMLANLRRDARALLSDGEYVGPPDTPDPALTAPAEKLMWLRQIGQEMETEIMPRIAALGADVPMAAPAAAYRFLAMVEATVLR